MAKSRTINIIYRVDRKQLTAAQGATEKVRASTDKLNKSIKETETVGTKAFKALGAAVSAVAIGALAKKIVDLGAAQQQLNIAFTTFLGDATKAKKLIAELTQFSIVTPFTPDQVNRAAKALLAFGVQGDKITKTLKFLGDVSAGTGKDLAEMAVIFGQIRSTGRLMGQDLLQLINAGFNPLQIISQKTGRAVVDLKKDMEKGLITFEMVEAAFIDATSAGGLFFNLMEKQSASVGGKLSTIAGNVQEIAKGIFESNIGIIESLTNKTVALTAAFVEFLKVANSDPVFDKATSILDAYTKGANEAGEDTDLLGEAIEQIAKSGNTQKANELFSSLTEAISKYQLQAKIAQEVVDKNSRFSNILKSEEIQAEKEKWESILAVNKKAIELLTETRAKLQKDAQDELTKLQLRQQGLEDELNRSAKDKELNFDSLFYGLKQELAEENEKRFQKIISDSNELTEDQFKEHYDWLFKQLVRKNDLELKEQDEANKKKREQEEQHQEYIKALKRQSFDYGLALIEQALMASVRATEIDIDAIRSKYDEEISLLRNREKEMTESDRRILELEKKRDEELEAARKRQAELDKRTAINQMIIQNLLNSVRALGTPPVPNFAAAGITLGYGLAQVAIARSSPGFKDGVIDLQGPGTSTSDSIPARLSKHESVMTAEETRRSMGILKDIRAKKLDDNIINKLRLTSSGVVASFDDSRMVKAIEGSKTDLSRQGTTLYEHRKVSENFSKKVRAKIINR